MTEPPLELTGGDSLHLDSIRPSGIQGTNCQTFTHFAYPGPHRTASGRELPSALRHDGVADAMSGGRHRGAWIHVRAGVVAALSAGAVAGCITVAPGEVSGLPNPADQHCIDQHHELVQVYDAGGVPVGTICVDRGNNRKCKSWAYYRGECSLGRKKGGVRWDGPQLETGKPRPKRSVCNDDGPYVTGSENRSASRGGCVLGAPGCWNAPAASSAHCRPPKRKY